MDIAKAKELACEIAGLLTVLHDNLCPDDCVPALMRQAEAKSSELARLLAYEPEADDIIDEMIDNAESEIVEKDEAEANTYEEPTEIIGEPASDEEPVEESINVSPDESVEEPIAESVEEPAEMPVSAPDEEICCDTTNEDTATDLNESVFMRTKVSSISKAFTINDKFRFKRELFGNSDPEFSNALDLISVMRSIDEAEDYFYNELGWDEENEDVKDFMRVVRAYFFNRQ